MKTNCGSRGPCCPPPVGLCIMAVVICALQSPPATAGDIAATTRPASRPVQLVDFQIMAADAPANVVLAASRCAVAHPDDPRLRYAVLVAQNRRSPAKYDIPCGLTTVESPCLFWFSTKPTQMTLEFVISRQDGASFQPVKRITITDALSSGIQRLDLKQLDVKLAPDVLYKWSIRYQGVADHAPSSEAFIRRLPDDDPRVTAVANSSRWERISTCAAKGVWYDLLQTVCGLIDDAPADAGLRQDRLKYLQEAPANLAITTWVDASSK
jgi:hypothetical protein